MYLSIVELGVFSLAFAWLPLMIWSLYVILTSSEADWEASGMNRLLWLLVVLFMPLVGSILFILAGRSRLQQRRVVS